MTVITELGLQDWEIKGIIADYRKLVKLEEALSCTTDAPFINLISFVEKMLPAFKCDLISGELCENYDHIRKLVVSDMGDEELINILLCRRS